MSALVVRASEILRDAIARGVTPGAQLAVSAGAEPVVSLALGTLDYGPDSRAVTEDTRFDLASITKLFTALALVRMSTRGAVSLRATAGEVLPDAHGSAVSRATLEDLLGHRAGLLHWAPFYKMVAPEYAGNEGARRLVLDAVMATPRGATGSVRYSDLGYMLLGECLTEIAREPLGAVIAREVSGPLGLASRVTYRGVGEGWRDAGVAPTEDCPWRGRVVQGEVHDENAFALGGIAGHAGLFGTARDVVTLGRAALDSLGGESAWFESAVMRGMIAPRAGGAHRLGWDGRGAQSPSSGERMGPRTFGHLGFTGTSLWCDPDQNVAIALVTNRVHPTRENAGIRALRPAVHDAIMEALAARGR